MIREKLVELKHESKLLTYLWHLVRQPRFVAFEKKLQDEAGKRQSGCIDERYEGLLELKNKHLGERCFIVATGPSLLLSDLELLQKEITFGMNSIVKLYDEISWRPTYYGIQDHRVYEKLESEIHKWYGDKSGVFVSSLIADCFSIPQNFQQFPLDVVYHDNYLELDRYFARFSDDAYALVYDGYSITYSLIQLAVYMGFKEIYLLGADCSYKRGAKNHVVESGNDDKNEEKNYDKMITGYLEAKKYADTHEIKIVNCTRGGMLEVFQRIPLETVLGKES